MDSHQPQVVLSLTVICHLGSNTWMGGIVSTTSMSYAALEAEVIILAYVALWA